MGTCPSLGGRVCTLVSTVLVMRIESRPNSARCSEPLKFLTLHCRQTAREREPECDRNHYGCWPATAPEIECGGQPHENLRRSTSVSRPGVKHLHSQSREPAEGVSTRPIASSFFSPPAIVAGAEEGMDRGRVFHSRQGPTTAVRVRGGVVPFRLVPGFCSHRQKGVL